MIPFQTPQQVLVFKTNIKTKTEVQKLRQVLNKKAIIKWNIDFEDIDKVLRVITQTLTPAEIIDVITKKGVECVELE
ncbi:MAG: hypothetical protein JWP12_3028 [Bacteroidetes bacterium]|nr:hypothetical protein [Bacteroidota bacterium]